MTKHGRARQFKLILIPVLVAVLGLRVAKLAGLGEVASAVQAASQELNPDGRDETNLVSQLQSAAGSSSNWPQRSLTEILSHDPFAMTRQDESVPELKPVEKPAAEREDSESRAATVDLKAIYRIGDSYVAMIGSQVVKTGDRLADGSLVVGIDEQGIVIQPAMDTDAE